MPLEIPSDFPKCPAEVEIYNALRTRHSLPDGLAKILTRKATIRMEQWITKLANVKHTIAQQLEMLGADQTTASLLAEEAVAKAIKTDPKFPTP